MSETSGARFHQYKHGRRMETTERRDGYPAARVLREGQGPSDRLISAHAICGQVRLDIINPASGEIKSWAVSRAAWLELVTDIQAGVSIHAEGSWRAIPETIRHHG